MKIIDRKQKKKRLFSMQLYLHVLQRWSILIVKTSIRLFIDNVYIITHLHLLQLILVNGIWFMVVVMDELYDELIMRVESGSTVRYHTLSVASVSS